MPELKEDTKQMAQRRDNFTKRKYNYTTFSAHSHIDILYEEEKKATYTCTFNLAVITRFDAEAHRIHIYTS